MVLLDGIGLGVGMPPQVGACCMPYPLHWHLCPVMWPAERYMLLTHAMAYQEPAWINWLHLPLSEECKSACLRWGTCWM